jgi:membrane-associated phospholipid phosphatase
MHYAVDALAGLVVGGVIALLVSSSVRHGRPSEPQTIEGLR